LENTYRESGVLISTGIIENSEASTDLQRYRMKYIKRESAALLPTIGATIGF